MHEIEKLWPHCGNGSFRSDFNTSAFSSAWRIVSNRSINRFLFDINGKKWWRSKINGNKYTHQHNIASLFWHQEIEEEEVSFFAINISIFTFHPFKGAFISLNMFYVMVFSHRIQSPWDHINIINKFRWFLFLYIDTLRSESKVEREISRSDPFISFGVKWSDLPTWSRVFCYSCLFLVIT